MITVDIPIQDAKKPPKLIFPDHCVNCRQSKANVRPVKLNTGAQGKGGQMVQLSFAVPLCADCTTKENKIATVTWIPFFAVGLLTYILVFIPVWFVAPEGTTGQTYAFPYVLGAIVGMIAGIVFGTLVESLLKLVFAPTYGKLLSKRPLTLFSIFNDSEDLIGLSTRFADNKKTLKLTFENDEVAHEFITLNSQEI